MGRQKAQKDSEGKFKPRGKPFAKRNTETHPLTSKSWKPTEKTEKCNLSGCDKDHYVHSGPTLGD